MKWRNPNSSALEMQQPKSLAFAVNTSMAAKDLVNIAVNGMHQMNQGQLWKNLGSRPFPQGGPGACEVNATATYQASGDLKKSARIALHLVAQHHISAPQIGLIMTFMDSPMGVYLLPWMDHVSESIVAYTILQIRLALAQALNAPLADPTADLTWYSGAWLTPQHINFHDWTIELAR
jgi:hypothetical protein